MAFRTLENVSVWDIKPPWDGGTCLDYADEVISVEWTESENADEDTATVRVPFASRIAASLVPRRIVLLHGAPDDTGVGEVRVFRIHAVTTDEGRDAVTRTAQCRSLLADLTDAGPMSVVLAGGRHEFTISATLNWQQWLTQFVLPHLARQGITWFLADTLTNATTIPQAITRQTAMQLMETLRSFLDYKLRLSPAGAVGLVAHPNDTLDPLLITTGKNLVRLSETRASIEQATVLQPVGGKGHSDVAGSIQHHVFGSTSYDLVNKRFQRDPVGNGGWSYPLLMADNQFVGLYAQRVKTGRCFQITATSLATQQLTLDHLTDGGTHPHGYWFELRESLTGTPISVPTPGRPLRVNGAPAGAVITLDDPLSGADPSPTDDVHVDCRLVPSPQVLSSTCSNIADVVGTNEQTLTIPSTAVPLVGDWGFLHDNAGTPWTLFGKVFDVVAVPSSTTIRVKIRYTFDSGKPFTAGAVAKQLKLYRARVGRPHVNDEVAATNQLTLTSASGILANDLVEYWLDNAGALLTGIPAPNSALSDDGVIRKTQDLPDHRCILNLFGDPGSLNPHFDTWFAGAPFGWTGAGITQLTTNLPGPGLVNAVRLTNGSLRSPVVYVRPTAGDSKVSVRVRVRTPAAANWNGTNLDQATLNVLVGGSSTSLGIANIHAPGHPSPSANSVEVKPSTVLEWDVLAVDLLHTPGAGAAYAPWSGIQVNIACTGTVAAQLDIGGIFAIHDSTLPEAGYMPPIGEQFLWGLATQELAAIADPERTVSVDAIDVGAVLARDYPSSELVPGRRVQVVSERTGIAVDERIAHCRFTARPRGAVTVDVRTKERRLVDVLARQLASRLPNA